MKNMTKFFTQYVAIISCNSPALTTLGYDDIIITNHPHP